MGDARIFFGQQARPSYKEVFPVLRGWKPLVRIEQYPHTYDGEITAVSEDTGKLTFSTVVTGEGKKELTFELAGAHFHQYTDLGEWDDIFMVYPRVGDWFVLRHSGL